MTLARRLLDSLAALFAYAMAPDDYDSDSRNAAIDLGRDGMEGADTLRWLEEWLAKGDVGDVVLSHARDAADGHSYVAAAGPGELVGQGRGVLEAVADVRRQVDGVDNQTANPRE